LTISTFADLGLAAPIQRAIAARNHTVPTPIQAQAIPELMQGRDMLGIAQTGTGKTGAFALPVLHALSAIGKTTARTGPRALVLAPTRELAIQIGEEFRAYGAAMPIRQTVIFGGVGYGPQIKALRGGVEIIVATPGRLIDHLNEGNVKLDMVEFLVLDEADRMLDMGFVRDVRKIVALTPAKRQSLLFSATMPDAIAKLAAEILTDPVRIEIAPQSTPVERIVQSVRHVEQGDKLDLLADLLSEPEFSRTIVFTRTKHRANRVAEKLEKSGIPAEAIHGNKSQTARQRALQRFRDGQVGVLVATDIAARGIDVDAVSHVINFELPNEPESYVHRIGRTARAGATGIAVSLCAPDERAYLRDIEKLTGIRMTVEGDAPGPEDRSLRAPHQMQKQRRPQQQKAEGPKQGGPKQGGQKPGGQRARDGGDQRQGHGDGQRHTHAGDQRQAHGDAPAPRRRSRRRRSAAA
jgi:ATP-dependent RNA helicase RhlE